MIANPAKRRKGVYKFIIKEDVHFLSTPLKKEFENDWIEIDLSGNITIKGSRANGYAWDGCSPKINLWDILLIGTPDGRINVDTGKPVTYYASLVHDALRQFRKDIGIKRKVADKILLYYLGDFQLRYLYYGALRLSDVILSLFGST